MVRDHWVNAHVYAPLGPRITRAFDYARVTDFASLVDGTYPVGGDDVRALVQRYATKAPGEGRWEAHRRFIDLQFLVAGRERIGVAPLSHLLAEPYDEEQDLLWLTGSGDFVTLVPGDFVLLWPGDGHMPGMAVDAAEDVTKVVIKIAVHD